MGARRALSPRKAAERTRETYPPRRSITHSRKSRQGLARASCRQTNTTVCIPEQERPESWVVDRRSRIVDAAQLGCGSCRIEERTTPLDRSSVSDKGSTMTPATDCPRETGISRRATDAPESLRA